ncbi:hypothetical protein PG987_006282 [Apiospora arundinis]
MFFKKHSKQKSSSSTGSESSSTRSTSQGPPVIRDSTTAMPMSVNSMRTWEVQNRQQQQQRREQQSIINARSTFAPTPTGTNWDQKNEDLERRAQGLPLRSLSMKKSWKNRTTQDPRLGFYS